MRDIVRNIDEKEDMTAIVGRFISGEDAAFGELYHRLKADSIRPVTRLIKVHGVIDVCSYPELVVASAFLKLCRARDRGALAHIQSGSQFVALLRAFADREMRDQGDRSRAVKRRGPFALGRDADRDHDLADFVEGADSPEKSFLSGEVYGLLHARLGKPVHQEVLAMRLEGYTVEEISCRLNLSAKSINRKLCQIRPTYLDMQIE